MKQDFLEYIKKRCYIHQCTDEKGISSLLENSQVGYIGFDCTSDSLHVGSLLPIMLLRIFQKFGHKPIILLGGGTTLIGDPSGKDETRQILDESSITNNKEQIKKIFEKFLCFDESNNNSAIIVDNYDWLSELNLISFLRNYGSKFSVNRMLSLESIKQRLSRQQNLSFLEFNYPIFQAYDFLKLNSKLNCSLQFGGSDQWGNIVSGIELIKKENKTDAFGITTPLVTTSSGTKMGKTANGAIWLTEQKLNVTDFWQFWRNTSDEDIFKFLYLFTEIPNNEIENSKHKTGADLNDLKILLANEVTKLCHSNEKSKKAQRQAEKILTTKQIDSETIDNCEKKVSINQKEFISGLFLKEILVRLDLSKSNGESKRLIEQGAVKLNNLIIKNKDKEITPELFQKHPKKTNTMYLMIYVGKKKYGLIELIS